MALHGDEIAAMMAPPSPPGLRCAGFGARGGFDGCGSRRLLYAVAREFLGDIDPEGLRGRDVLLARGRLAAPELRKSSAVQRVRELRVDAQRGIVIGDRGVGASSLQVGERAGIVGR